MRRSFYLSVPKAFSLIELMIVIAIIGLLVGVSVPSFLKYKTRAKLAESYSLLASIQKAQSTYFADNQRYRSLEPNPATITPVVKQTIVQDSSWLEIGDPLGIDNNTYFGYIAYAGFLDESSNEFVVNTDGTTSAAGAYSFGPHPNSGADTCPSTTSTGNFGLTMSASTDWVVMIATADLTADSGLCTLIFQTMETTNGGISYSPFVTVNVGE